VAPSAAALLRRNGTDPTTADRPAVLFGDTAWTHAELLAESLRWADAFRSLRPRDLAVPFHVGVLLDNTPAYLAALGGAAFAGSTLVGLNPTRQGEQLARDITHTELCAVVTEPRHALLLREVQGEIPVSPTRVYTTRRWTAEEDAELPGVGGQWDSLLALAKPTDSGPDADPELTTTWCLVFTSGTSSAPKAVICSQRRMLLTGERMRIILDVGRDDVGYLSMPLFHSNSLMVGLMPALIAGAAVALARRFTASGWLADVRRHGVTYWNYTGKPLAYLLATPEQPDDADNPVRRAYGNEGSDRVVAAFAERFGVDVIDAFGPTEGGIGIIRQPDDPPGALGHAGEKVKVVDADGSELPRARFAPTGVLLNASECVGEIVNTAGPGPFEGYWRNEEADARATRNGWYWTGDLGYVDDAGYVYFAGRAADRLRVDGENFPAAPVEAAVSRHPDVVAAAVYGVPDADAGDAVMAALVLKDGRDFDPDAFTRWLDEQPDLPPKWRPRWLRLTGALPTTPTHKVLHRQLQHEKWRSDLTRDPVLHRPRGAGSFVPFTRLDELVLRQAFERNGRERFWEM
jgi:fatty-acyl-CoA synthase